MADSPDLEISIYGQSGGYGVTLRLTQPDGNADNQVSGDGNPIAIDLDALAEQLDQPDYGKTLTAQVFSAEVLRTTLAKAQTDAAGASAALRVRLFIGGNAPELHGLRWELLQDPADGTPLTSTERVLFSRYLSSTDWRPVRLRPRGELRALVAIADPSDLESYKLNGQSLAPIDADGELARAKAALDPGHIVVTAVNSGGAVSVNTLVSTLRDGYDVLYLVAHGALVKGQPRLWLEDDTGKTAVVNGAELVDRICAMDQPPRLVVLASCQSAGTGDDATAGDGALAALGPRFARGGIPAVLAMQGSVTMKTVATFMPVFFTELARDGVLDRAIAAARAAVRDRPDAWMPVLFSRLRSGRIWYVPGTGSGGDTFEDTWKALKTYVKSADPDRFYATPVIGAGLSEPVIGATRQIAQALADKYSFPLETSAADELPQVTQFIALRGGTNQPLIEVETYIKQRLRERFADALRDAPADAALDALLKLATAARYPAPNTNPYAVLAAQPFKLFLNTNSDNLMADALSAAGKQPVVEIFPWSDDLYLPDSIFSKEPQYRATAERPLVYHMFGHNSAPDSVVLTEDQYFNWMISFSRNRDQVPEQVRRAMVDSALVFLGFQLDEWDFRVLFRSVMSLGGIERRGRYPHVGVQVTPEEGRIADPHRAQSYLSDYFGGEKINVYWGSSDDFIRDLVRVLAEA